MKKDQIKELIEEMASGDGTITRMSDGVELSGEQRDEMMAKLAQAFEDGHVQLPTEDGEFVFEDPTGTKLYLDGDCKWSGDSIGLTLGDGGGFTGIIIPVDDWESIRDHIEAAVRAKRASLMNA